MNTDMKRLEMLIADLNKIGIKPFIGYGNPNADILIIGKECAEENTERQEKFYTHNFEQWEESLNGHGFTFILIMQKNLLEGCNIFGFLPTIIIERWEKYR